MSQENNFQNVRRGDVKQATVPANAKPGDNFTFSKGGKVLGYGKVEKVVARGSLIGHALIKISKWFGA